jgi:hypothetical protein
MSIRLRFPIARGRRLRQAIAVISSRIRRERELLSSPRLELPAARHMVRSHRRLEVLRSQLR